MRRAGSPIIASGGRNGGTCTSRYAFLMDTPRACQRCGFKWWAQFVGPTPKPGAILFGAGTNVALAHQRLKRDQYRQCPNCGATKVKTMRAKGFEPTGAVAPASARACIECAQAMESGWAFCPHCGLLAPD